MPILTAVSTLAAAERTSAAPRIRFNRNDTSAADCARRCILIDARRWINRADDGATGFDLHACLDAPLRLTRAPQLVPTGIALEFPCGFDVQVRPRSGLSSKGVGVAFGTQRCSGATLITATLFFGCPVNSDDVRVRLIEGEFEGSASLGLRQTGHSGGIDSVVAFDDTLWIDPVTYLPIAFVSHGVDRYALGGPSTTFDRVRRYHHEFVGADAIPPDFFESTAIGYVDP